MRQTNNSLLHVVCALKLSSLPLRQGICSMFESTQIRSDTLSSLELAADLAVQRLLVGLDRQQEVGPLLL